MPRSQTPPPDDFDTESKALWKKTRKFLEDQSTWEPSDVGTLERYVRAVEKARLAWEGVPRVGGKLDMTAVGSQGQLVQHPNVKTARDAERDAQDYARDLLLTPKAREQHNLAKKAAEEGGKFGFGS